jgi:hypothetical protein
VVSGDANRLDLRAASDSAIVSGLIALLLRVYSGHGAREILDTDPAFINAIGLGKHLSPTRSNGLAAMVVLLCACASKSGFVVPACADNGGVGWADAGFIGGSQHRSAHLGVSRWASPGLASGFSPTYEAGFSPTCEAGLASLHQSVRGNA